MLKKYFWRIFWNKLSLFLKRVLFNSYKLRTYYFLKGTFAAFIRLPVILKERERIQAMRRVSIDYLDSIMDKDFL
jgi:hypothetical protein